MAYVAKPISSSMPSAMNIITAPGSSMTRHNWKPPPQHHRRNLSRGAEGVRSGRRRFSQLRTTLPSAAVLARLAAARPDRPRLRNRADLSAPHGIHQGATAAAVVNDLPCCPRGLGSFSRVSFPHRCWAEIDRRCAIILRGCVIALVPATTFSPWSRPTPTAMVSAKSPPC